MQTANVMELDRRNAAASAVGCADRLLNWLRDEQRQLVDEIGFALIEGNHDKAAIIQKRLDVVNSRIDESCAHRDTLRRAAGY